MRAGRILGRVILFGVLGFVLFVLFFPSIWPVISGGTRGRYVRQQKHYAASFKAGNTNVPLFAMDWFAPTVHFCRVNQSGKGSARRDVGHAIQSGASISLNETNLQALVEAINQLPSPPKRFLPVVRQIVVGCIRSNQWFRAVYDRADIPGELEKIAEIAGASLPWYIPTVQGHAVARLAIPNFSGSFVCASGDAAIAVSSGQRVTNGAYYFPGEIQVWNLAGSTKPLSPPLKVISGSPSWGDSTAISPDGSTVAIATEHGLYAVDWENGKLAWKADPLDHDSYMGKHLAISNDGRTLFSAGAHIIESWDLLSGQKKAVLITGEPNDDGIVRFLKTSRNGKVLVAGFGLHYNWRPQSFAIWEAEKNEPAFKFEEKEGAAADLSPDGEVIALSRFGRKELVLFKWRTRERTEVLLRNSPGTYSVFWSPDGKRLAAYVDTYPASIYIYDTTTWRPVAQWDCGQIGEGSKFTFGKDRTLFQIRGNEINALDVSSLKRLTDD